MHKEIPILFSTPMVQAILEGRKIMTRRIVKDKTALQWLEPDMFTPEFVANPDNNLCRYGKPGDLLWVRESFNYFGSLDPGYLSYKATYPADLKVRGIENIPAISEVSFKPSIHMPKDIARIWLEVTEVRVERLQDIPEDDAINEGVVASCEISCPSSACYSNIAAFEFLWHKINGEASWKANPWVWVVSFKVLSTTGKPVDKMEAETIGH